MPTYCASFDSQDLVRQLESANEKKEDPQVLELQVRNSLIRHAGDN